MKAAMVLWCTAGCAGASAQAPDAVSAMTREPSRWYVEAGQSLQSGTSVGLSGLGVTLPLGNTWPGLGGGISAQADLFVNQWRATALQGGRESYTQVGAIALLRYRFGEGRSRWFTEAGLGVTQIDSRFWTPDREFSTRFQFTEVLALGLNFGEASRHELSVRAQHVSNGSIRRPNPGSNFVRLRYAYAF